MMYGKDKHDGKDSIDANSMTSLETYSHFYTHQNISLRLNSSLSWETSLMILLHKLNIWISAIFSHSYVGVIYERGQK